MGQLFTKKDFVSDQEVRWCPGCGDYVILSAMQKLLADLGIEREKVVFVSGIGCSSRFPYYMNTYGFHTIHGRAPAFATGLALSRPDLSVWVITGDGDGLSIGGNHLIHALRRNINLKIILFNNQTYGLTKGQYSPTSHLGTISKSTPYGSLDNPFQPLPLALGAGASFVARTYDKDPKHLSMVLRRATEHSGTAFIEVYQNCVIFNDNVFGHTTAKEARGDRILFLEKGQPLLFGSEQQYTLQIDENFVAQKMQVNDVGRDDFIVHRESGASVAYAFCLSQLGPPNFPEVMGVLRAEAHPTYEEGIARQNAGLHTDIDINALLRQGDVWEIH